MNSRYFRPDGTPCTEQEAMNGTVLRDGYTMTLPLLMKDSATMPISDIEKAAIIRSDIMLGAKRVLGDSYDPTGKTNIAIQRDVVRQMIGDAANTMDGMELSGAFKAALVVDAKSGQSFAQDTSSKAYKEYRDSLSEMWKGPEHRA